MLVKSALQKEIYNGFYRIFSNQATKATSGDENEDPDAVIKQMTNDMAKVVAEAVDAYIKSGDIIIGPQNLSATSPTGSCVIVPGEPAKIK